MPFLLFRVTHFLSRAVKRRAFYLFTDASAGKSPNDIFSDFFCVSAELITQEAILLPSAFPHQRFTVLLAARILFFFRLAVR